MSDVTNVLILLTDQQQPGSLGCYGNQTVQTPNLDRLAERSTVFEHAICAQPLCTPSRASIFTGTYPHTHGLVGNNRRLPRQIPTLAEMVIDHRVRTGYIGKWHLGNESLPQRGFEEFFHAVDDDYTRVSDLPLYGPCSYSRWLAEHGETPDDPRRPGCFTRESCARLPEERSKPAFIYDKARQFLDARRDEPFLLVCSFLEPHNPYHSAYDDLHDRDEIDLPADHCTHPRPDWPLRNTTFQRWTRDLGHGEEPPVNSPERWRDMIARYYGACHLVDRWAGRILEHLARLNLTERTLVIYTSDHGDMMGSQGIFMKSMMFEPSQTVPLIVHDPSVDRPQRVRESVSLVDLVPTVLEALNIEPPAHAQLQGESFLPLVRGQREPDPDRLVVAEWNGVVQRNFVRHAMFDAVKDQFIRSIRNDRWKLNVHVNDLSELYDLHDDPYETRNRINDEACTQTLDELFTALRDWQQRTGDTLVLPPPRRSATVAAGASEPAE